MTLASCAPEGTAADFKIGVLEAAPPRSRASPGAPSPPGSPSLSAASPRPPRAPRSLLDTFSQPRFNQTHWDGTEQAPGTRNTARATTREQAEPRAPAPPLTRAPPRGPPSGPRRGPEGAGAPARWLPLGGGRGTKGRRSPTAPLPAPLPVGPGAKSGRGGREEARRAGGPGRPAGWARPGRLGGRGARLWGAGGGVGEARGHNRGPPISRSGRRGWGARSPDLGSLGAGADPPRPLGQRVRLRPLFRPPVSFHVKCPLEPPRRRHDFPLVWPPTNRISQQERDFKLTIKITNCNSFSCPLTTLKHINK